MTINEFITTYQSEIIISLITGIFTAFAVWILTYKVLIARIKCSKVILKENDGVYRFVIKSWNSISDIKLSCSILLIDSDEKRYEVYIKVNNNRNRVFILPMDGYSALKVPVRICIDDVFDEFWNKLPDTIKSTQLNEKYNKKELNIEDILGINAQLNEMRIQVSAYHRTTGLKRYTLKTYTKSHIKEGDFKSNSVKYILKEKTKKDKTPEIE